MSLEVEGGVQRRSLVALGVAVGFASAAVAVFGEKVVFVAV